MTYYCGYIKCWHHRHSYKFKTFYDLLEHIATTHFHNRKDTLAWQALGKIGEFKI